MHRPPYNRARAALGGIGGARLAPPTPPPARASTRHGALVQCRNIFFGLFLGQQACRYHLHVHFELLLAYLHPHLLLLQFYLVLILSGDRAAQVALRLLLCLHTLA